MFEFISNSKTLKQKYNKINTFFDGWFTSPEKPSLKDIEEYFPTISTWDGATLFSAMLWVYYNFPIDFLYKKNPNISGIKLYRKGNLARVACFIANSELSFEKQMEIMQNLIENTIGKDSAYSVYGSYPTEEIDAYLKGFYIQDIEDVIISKNLNHPFDLSKILLKKRLQPDILFTKEAINIDKELMPRLVSELIKWEAFREFRVEKRQENKKQNIEQLNLENKQQKQQREAVEYARGLFDQAPGEILGIQSPWEPKTTYVKRGPFEGAFKVFTGFVDQNKVVESPRHQINTKPFIPYKEEIGFDIDPWVISDKIRMISAES